MTLDGHDAGSLFSKYDGLTYDDINLLPGHGEATTVDEERRTNPFVR